MDSTLCKKQGVQPVCQCCGTRFAKVIQGELLGCPACYRAFYLALIPFTRGQEPCTENASQTERAVRREQ